MELTEREQRVLEAVGMHPNKGGSTKQDFPRYIAGATGFAITTSQNTLGQLKRMGALVGHNGHYYTLDSSYALECKDMVVEEKGEETPDSLADLRPALSALLREMKKKNICMLTLDDDGEVAISRWRMEETTVSLEG